VAYQSSKKKREAKALRKGLILTSIALTVIGSVTIAYNYLIESRVEIDSVTLCPAVGPIGVTAVLIDSTDTFTSIQREFLEKYFDELRETLEQGELVEIYSALDFSESGFEPMISLCNPGDGSGASELTAAPERLRRRWQQLFDGPLQETLHQGLESGGSNRSPIFQMIKALSIRAYPLQHQSIPLNLYIVSDMLENTGKYNQYSDSADFSTVSDRPFFAHINPNLLSVSVTVLYVSRERYESLQTRQHAEFWAHYFERFGANLRLVKRI
jgi:hypothetical protein